MLFDKTIEIYTTGRVPNGMGGYTETENIITTVKGHIANVETAVKIQSDGRVKQETYKIFTRRNLKNIIPIPYFNNMNLYFKHNDIKYNLLNYNIYNHLSIFLVEIV